MKNSILFLVNIDTFFVSHRLPIGRKLLDEGYDVHLVSKFTKYEKKLIRLGFKTHHINFKRESFNLINSIISILKISIVLLKVKPKILHLISIRSIILGGLASLMTPVNSFVFSITGIGSIYLNKNFVNNIRIFIVNLCLKIIFFRASKKSKFIFQNRDDLKFLKKLTKINKKDFIIIKGSGIFLKKKKFIKIKNKIPKILMVSRLIADKGVFEYIEAIKLCKKVNPNIKFFLIGDPDPGNPTSINMNIIRNLQKQKTLNYLPHQTKIIKFIRESSLIVLPSYREGFPKIVIEAASTGRPVITTNVAGCRDAVINNKTGLLVPARNSKALAKAIIKISSNNKLMNQMGKNSLIYAEKNFNIKYVISKHLKIYKKLF